MPREIRNEVLHRQIADDRREWGAKLVTHRRHQLRPLDLELVPVLVDHDQLPDEGNGANEDQPVEADGTTLRHLVVSHRI